MKMGETRVDVRIHGPLGGADVEVLVDTGATFTKIPRSVASSIGAKPRTVVQAQVADGRILEREIAQCDLEFNGQVWTVPVMIGAENETPLLGLTTLETFRLKVNPITRRLELANVIEYLLS